MAERRLIDANALMDVFRRYMAEHWDRERCVSEENCNACDLGCLWRRTVNDAPTIDAVEVVRCKDCKHSRELDKYEKHMYLSECVGCTYHGKSFCALIMMGDDFCSYGERRDST